MEYQGRTLLPIRQIIKRKKILSALEKMLGGGEALFIDIKPALYKFKRGQGPDFEKYSLYAVRDSGVPRFLKTIDILVKLNRKVLGYRIN